MPRRPKKKGKTALGDNLYEIKKSYWLIFTYKGKTYRERIGRVDEIPLTSAKHIANKLKAQIIENQYIERVEAPKFSDMAKRYLEWYKTERVDVSKRTLLETERRINMLIEAFKGLTLDEFSELLIEEYKQSRLKLLCPKMGL